MSFVGQPTHHPCWPPVLHPSWPGPNFGALCAVLIYMNPLNSITETAPNLTGLDLRCVYVCLPFDAFPCTHGFIEIQSAISLIAYT